MTRDQGKSTPPLSLKDMYGSMVELSGDGGAADTYQIMAELELDGRRYAVLQSESMRKEGDIEVFRITAALDGHPELETIEDDEEWERVAEAYDDNLFGSDERP